ncbi:oligosaccharide flippase family protein [Luteimonas sp. MC1825]|uniref:lipopolysaccharide biosynthesis protein n=1 Tax=Luteimonas sp. MC1825 TaxID=2761107 RepID=UPI00161CC286|nr:oligosaccharide flippase family protein [Luteimonas sp. MC1825]MBB6599046.1 oligosaccharide flippase family protein [Luteimonas sp. MC1825]QOC89179.1 oligosaccharide flippase family protein [Luteimonas sp. MC1825]
MNLLARLARPGLGRTIINAVLGSAGLRMAGMGLGFLVGVQLARGLGAEGYGIYGVAMSVLTVLMVPAEFGMPQLLIREVGAAQVNEDWGRMHGVTRWASRAAWLSSAVISVAVLGWIIATDRAFEMPLTLTLLAGLSMVPLAVLGRQKGAAVLGLQHIVKGQLPDSVVRPAVFSLLLLIAHLFALRLSPALAMLLGTLSAAVAFVVVVAMYKRLLPTAVHHAAPISDSRRWWASAMPMALTEGMRSLQGNLATLVMGAMAPAAAVGVFRVAVSVSIAISLPVSLFTMIGSPLIARLHAQGDAARLQRLLGWLALGMTAGSILLALPFIIAGGALMARVFGDEFGASTAPLLILCAGGIVYSMLGPAVVVLNMSGYERKVSRAFGISVATLIIVMVPLVHFHGAIGAAAATALAMVLGNILMWWDARRLLALDSSVFSLMNARRGGDE